MHGSLEFGCKEIRYLFELTPIEIDHERNMCESWKFHAQEQPDLMDSVQRYLHETEKKSL